MRPRIPKQTRNHSGQFRREHYHNPNERRGDHHERQQHEQTTSPFEHHTAKKNECNCTPQHEWMNRDEWPTQNEKNGAHTQQGQSGCNYTNGRWPVCQWAARKSVGALVWLFGGRCNCVLLQACIVGASMRDIYPVSTHKYQWASLAFSK